MLTHKDVTIELEEQENGQWTGGISEFGEGQLALIAFPGEGQYGKYLSLSEALSQEERDGGKEAKQFGFLNFKTRYKKKDNAPFLTMTSRSFSWNGLCMPVQGIVNDQGDKKFIKLKFDNYYYDSQKSFWEGKHEYVLSNGNAEQAPNPIEEECPF